MKVKKVIICLLLCLILTLSLTACGSGSGSDASSASASRTSAETVSADVTNLDNIDDLKIDNTKWKYDESNDVYYQIGVSYCTDPADEGYETLAVYVPGAYMDARDNGAGTSALSKYWRINTGIEQGRSSCHLKRWGYPRRDMQMNAAAQTRYFMSTCVRRGANGYQQPR